MESSTDNPDLGARNTKRVNILLPNKPITRCMYSFRKLLLERLFQMVKNYGFLSNISSASDRGTTQQNKYIEVYKYEEEAFENKQYFPAALLGISEPFDRVSNTGLLYKLLLFLRLNYFILHKSYV
jgi:hypothetical protein